MQELACSQWMKCVSICKLELSKLCIRYRSAIWIAYEQKLNACVRFNNHVMLWKFSMSKPEHTNTNEWVRLKLKRKMTTKRQNYSKRNAGAGQKMEICKINIIRKHGKAAENPDFVSFLIQPIQINEQNTRSCTRNKRKLIWNMFCIKQCTINYILHINKQYSCGAVVEIFPFEIYADGLCHFSRWK